MLAPRDGAPVRRRAIFPGSRGNGNSSRGTRRTIPSGGYPHSLYPLSPRGPNVPLSLAAYQRWYRPSDKYAPEVIRIPEAEELSQRAIVQKIGISKTTVNVILKRNGAGRP